ncbi:MAG: sigma-54-dependent Fis family transcriptional regulator [Gammaproteobacteria bacterium]|nr:sigma-54-dependent Fis family transcriptional regulator [Gammaproteobacteria bacterium]
MMSVLIVDSDIQHSHQLQLGLQKHCGLIEIAEDTASAEILRQRCHFNLIIADIQLPVMSAIEWVVELREQRCDTAVIFMLADSNVETSIAALRAGAADLITKPFDIEQMTASVLRCMGREQVSSESQVAPAGIDHLSVQSGFIGEGDLIKSVGEVIRRVAPMPSTVMIEGESGTGKELAARAIHQWSGRAGAFVPVNCGAISAELIESEFFGHVKGAFTGAHQIRKGLFTYADGGTLFLDEIGEMPLSMQAHLLRVLEERTIRPVGSNREIAVDVRIVAATNRDLDAEVKKGNFRADLYFRLNVLSIRMPALREIEGDIAVLARYFVHTIARDLGVKPSELGDAEMNYLRSHDWPGNVRELKNVIERCLLLNSKPSQCIGGGLSALPDADAPEDDVSLAAVEKKHILKVLEMEGGNKSAAARRLGIARKTLERKVRAWAQQ